MSTCQTQLVYARETSIDNAKQRKLCGAWYIMAATAGLVGRPKRLSIQPKRTDIYIGI